MHLLGRAWEKPILPRIAAIFSNQIDKRELGGKRAKKNLLSKLAHLGADSRLTVLENSVGDMSLSVFMGAFLNFVTSARGRNCVPETDRRNSFTNEMMTMHFLISFSFIKLSQSYIGCPGCPKHGKFVNNQGDEQ